MRYGSVCSGIEAATQAWHGLGWTPAFFSDIEKFPVAVLQHHYPDVPLHGDFTSITEDDYGPIDLLVGGTPCQSFSIAGLRGGMDDERGNLALEFIRLAQRKRPQWLVWENVPGVLSSNGGRDFGSFLGALAEIGYGFAYRVLDAQYFGVAQRRRRVFVVGYLGDWRRAAAVLFERESLSGNPAPIREEGEKVAPAVTTGPPFSRTGNERVECEAIVPVTARMRGFGDYECDGTASALKARDYKDATDLVAEELSVRRLTPIECERLQGFPDGFTQIPWRGKEPENCPDGPRYKALGNSMAVPVMRWIGERIQAVEALS
jgi:DNA (cytosine-5)-methyltransferase 1